MLFFIFDLFLLIFLFAVMRARFESENITAAGQHTTHGQLSVF